MLARTATSVALTLVGGSKPSTFGADNPYNHYTNPATLAFLAVSVVHSNVLFRSSNEFLSHFERRNTLCPKRRSSLAPIRPAN
jgi:hypothetical protein